MINDEHIESTDKIQNEKSNYLNTNYSHKKTVQPYDFFLIAHLLKKGGVPTNGYVLDLACGTGSFKAVFEKNDFVYSGVDIDNSDTSMNILKCDIANGTLPFVDNHFDLIFFKMGIEHLTIKEISHCLLESRRVLKSNGKIIVLTPDWKWNYKVFYDEYTHQTPFTVSSLKTALRMSNLNVELCETIVQLPVVWKFPILKNLCNLISLLYPFTKKSNKFIKFSKERVLVAIAKK